MLASLWRIPVDCWNATSLYGVLFEQRREKVVCAPVKTVREMSFSLTPEQVTALCALATIAPRLVQVVEEAEEKMNALARRVDDLEARMKASAEARECRCDHAERLEALETYTRRSNIVVSGLKEIPGETHAMTEDLIRRFLNDTMSYGDFNIERCHRLGARATPGRPRRIIFRVSFFKDKEEIMRRRGSLKGTNVYLDDDYPRYTREKRDELRRLALPIARESGEKLTLVYPFNAVRVGRRTFQREQLMERGANNNILSQARSYADAARTTPPSASLTPRSQAIEQLERMQEDLAEEAKASQREPGQPLLSQAASQEFGRRHNAVIPRRRDMAASGRRPALGARGRSQPTLDGFIRSASSKRRREDTGDGQENEKKKTAHAAALPAAGSSGGAVAESSTMATAAVEEISTMAVGGEEQSAPPASDDAASEAHSSVL